MATKKKIETPKPIPAKKTKLKRPRRQFFATVYEDGDIHGTYATKKDALENAEVTGLRAFGPYVLAERVSAK